MSILDYLLTTMCTRMQVTAISRQKALLPSYLKGVAINDLILKYKKR